MSIDFCKIYLVKENFSTPLPRLLYALLFLAPFGGVDQAEQLLLTALPFFLRLATTLLSLFMIAIIYESLN